jgi:hypothetical protein
MTIESVGAWLWGKFGADVVKQVAGKFKDQWAKFNWDLAAKKYRQRMQDLYSTTRMLGKPEPISLEGIFTDVYLLDRPTALQRFDLEALKTEYAERGMFVRNAKRSSALRLASQQDRLFILGKPGAGKTTFLKYLTLRSATGDLDRVPIFISLNVWASSDLALLPFIEQQFDICAFPDAAAFIQQLLNRGEALICFDGLDEVNEAYDKRAAITQAMRNFADKYPANKFLITCRIAATDYTFEKFVYVEMADFTPEQVQVFARKWFAPDEARAKHFGDELSRDDNRGLRELAQTPLLLALLCLNFEETLTFPARRAELYEEALDALLKKWDASRNIKRDNLYQGLSLGRKRQLLTRVAAEFFERGELFFRQVDLAQRIGAFLKNLPGTEFADEPEGLAVLKAIEAQHGLFVERAHHIYSFSHLTIQEYFTARYIVEHSFDGALERLINQHFSEYRWREVFLLTASLLPTEVADAFFAAFQRALDTLIRDDEYLLAYGRWAALKAADYTNFRHQAIARASARTMALLFVNRARAFDRTRAFDLDRAIARVRARALDLALALVLDSDRAFDIDFILNRHLALDQILGFARALALDRDRARALAHTLGRALDSDLVVARARDHDRDLARDLERTSALVRDPDLTLMYVWLFVLVEYGQGVKKLLRDVEASSRRENLPEHQQALIDMELPAEAASHDEWQVFADKFHDLMIRPRNLGHDWNFTDDQRQRLDQYEQGTVLLAECLQLAAVSDRKAIEHRLLLPPER